jgi:hypothetical protein
VATGVVPEPVEREKALSALDVAWIFEPATSSEARDAFEDLVLIMMERAEARGTALSSRTATEGHSLGRRTATDQPAGRAGALRRALPGDSGAAVLPRARDVPELAVSGGNPCTCHRDCGDRKRGSGGIGPAVRRVSLYVFLGKLAGFS